jgi:hypothetical protein
MVLVVVLVSFGQVQRQPMEDLNSLVGKEVTVQRVALCQPGGTA